MHEDRITEPPGAPSPASPTAAWRALPVFVNVAAGRSSAEVWRRLVRALSEAGVAHELRPVEPQSLGSAVRRYVDAAAPERVGVSGGDGTIRAAAAALAGSASALVMFPGGTLNHFAKRHGIADLDAAAGAAAAGHVRSVPIGVVDDDFFLNTVTFGCYAEVVRRRERWRRWLRRWPAAGIALATLLARLPRVEVDLVVDGEPIRRSTPLLWIGLGWGAFPRAHQAAERRSMPDLEVAILRTPTRRAAAAFVARMIPRLHHSERPVRDRALELFHARSVLVRAPALLDATMDGELFRYTAPVFVGVQDDALRLLTPRNGPLTSEAARA